MGGRRGPRGSGQFCSRGGGGYVSMSISGTVWWRLSICALYMALHRENIIYMEWNYGWHGCIYVCLCQATDETLLRGSGWASICRLEFHTVDMEKRYIHFLFQASYRKRRQRLARNSNGTVTAIDDNTFWFARIPHISMSISCVPLIANAVWGCANVCGPQQLPLIRRMFRRVSRNLPGAKVKGPRDSGMRAVYDKQYSTLSRKKRAEIRGANKKECAQIQSRAHHNNRQTMAGK